MTAQKLDEASYGMAPGTVVRGVPLASYGVEPPRLNDVITILSIDPGGTTGWYVATITGDCIMHQMGGQLVRDEHHVALDSLVNQMAAAHPHLVIVIEDFRAEFGRPTNNVALEYIGVVKAAARKRLIQVVVQDRTLKDWWTSDRLRKAGFWTTKSPHANDAARHWLAYATKLEGFLDARRLIMNAIRGG